MPSFSVTYPAPYDTAIICPPNAGFFEADTPAPPTPTWDEIEITFPEGCQLETEICWGVSFSRDPSTVAAVAGAPACESLWEADQWALPASYGVGGFGHTADWGPEYPWQGYGVTKYEVLVDGVIVATLNGSVSYPGGTSEGPVWTPPATCVTLSAGAVNWSSVREVSIRAYYNDVPRFVVFCFKQEELDCDHTHVGVVSCNSDPTHSLCQEDFIEPLRSRKHDFPHAPSNQPTACGAFGAGIACSTCTCCQPLETSPQHCGIRLWSSASRLDFEKIDLIFESPTTEEQCPKPFCQDFESCGSAEETRFGTADCAETGFYCSPTHVLSSQLGASNYWSHEAISGTSPVYLAAVLWLTDTWTLPPDYSNDALVLAVEGAGGFFDGIAIRITSDGGGNPTIYAVGAYGILGSSWTSWGTPVELCLGEPNCLQFKYRSGIDPSPPFAVGEGVINGVSMGQDVRSADLTEAPFVEAILYGAIDYSADPSALTDRVWHDDVCYGQTGWITCACSCPGATGDVYLTKSVAPEAPDPSWSPPSASGVVNLRGVHPSVETVADPPDPGVSDGYVHLNVRIDKSD